MAAQASQRAPSGRFIRAYLLTWGLLAAGGLTYLSSLAWHPQLFSPSQRPQMAEPDPSIQAANKALAEVGTRATRGDRDSEGLGPYQGHHGPTRSRGESGAGEASRTRGARNHDSDGSCRPGDPRAGARTIVTTSKPRASEKGKAAAVRGAPAHGQAARHGSQCRGHHRASQDRDRQHPHGAAGHRLRRGRGHTGAASFRRTDRCRTVARCPAPKLDHSCRAAQHAGLAAAALRSPACGGRLLPPAGRPAAQQGRRRQDLCHHGRRQAELLLYLQNRRPLVEVRSLQFASGDAGTSSSARTLRRCATKARSGG